MGRRSSVAGPATALALLALLPLPGCWSRSAPPAGAPVTFAVRAARLLDPATGTLSRDVVVLVAGDRIAGVQSAASYAGAPGVGLVDLGDATLLPGLIDAHVHLSLGGPPRAAALAILRAGFTTVADLGAVTHRIAVVRDSIAAGVWEGPRVLTAGLWIGVQGGVCEFSGIGLAPNADAFRARVRENVEGGANLIKACVTGWPAEAWSRPDSAELPLTLLSALVEEAKARGRPVVAHALSREGVRRSLDAGVDGLVHAAYLDDALARRMREQAVWLIPTLASLTRGDTSLAARELADGVRAARLAGVSLVYGTDGGVLPHGQNASEATDLVAAGVPALDVLRAATVNAARALGVADSVGTVAPGMSADLVAFGGDPLEDPRALGRPVFVMVRGRVAVAPGG